VSRVLTVILFGGILLAASACGERSEPTGTSVDPYPVTVTGAEGPATRLDTKPRRILAIGSEMLLTLRRLDVQASVAREGAGVPGGRFDLILAWSSNETGDPFSFRRGPLRDAAVYVAADRSLDDVQRSLHELGLLLERPLVARRLVDRIERQRRNVAERLEGVRNVTVYLDTGFSTVTSNSLPGAMIAEARGVNVAGLTDQGPLNSDELRKSNPEYYLTTSDSGATLAGLRRNSELRTLDAVREGRFGIVPARLLEPGPTVGDGVEALARLLHPDAFR
jgi:ABC-type Fe3+-hydroxamate transport system substrate-binding protein